MQRILFLSLLYATFIFGAETPFNRGVNLTEWFQADSPEQIQFTKFTKQDFINIKSLGCDVIRLPINLHFMTNGTPNYTVSPLFYFFLDQVIDWAEELEIHLILDNHTFDPAENTDPNIGDVLVPVWIQIAERYQNRSNYIYYEVLNEPHGISDAAWNTIQQNVVTAIRSVDTKHTIIIGPASWNSYNNLTAMPAYADSNLIYTFHFYDPFLFTHQGASWTNPSMVPLDGVPFPFDASRMPATPPELAGTWIASAMNSYSTDGTVAKVKQLLDKAIAFKESRDVPIFCGEFGVYKPNSNNTDRVFWYEIVRSYLEENGIAWTTWDYQGGFGLFEDSAELFDYDLNISLLDALGLNVPPQINYVRRPDSTMIEIYDDYIGQGLYESSYLSTGEVSFYSDTNPQNGNYCIYWTGVSQYNYVGFQFRPIKDLSYLVEQGYVLDLWVKGDSPDASFDIRFVDSKTDVPEDHPWRMGTTIDGSATIWNGQWRHTQIPLSNFAELGSWDNEWFEPQGLFDWHDVEHFEIVAEHHNLQNIQFWFDDIRILHPALVSVENQIAQLPDSPVLMQNYPNPFNPKTIIPYAINETALVKIEVYNVLGQKVRTLLDKRQAPGFYQIEWDAQNTMRADVASGLYLIHLSAGKFKVSRPILLAK